LNRRNFHGVFSATLTRSAQNIQAVELTQGCEIWHFSPVARKLKIKGTSTTKSKTHGEASRSQTAVRRQRLWVAQSLRTGSRPNLVSLRSRVKH
jgi:hypothetical protein